MFDSDGTLADTLPCARRILGELADKHGFRRLPEAEMTRLRNASGRDLMRELDIPLRKLPAVVHDVRVLMKRDIQHLSLFPGVDSMLRGLHAKGRQLGVISSNSEENVRHILGPELAAMVHRFSCGVSMFGKAPRIRSMVKAMRIEPAASIYVGDEVRDAEASQAAKVAFGGVSWGQHTAEGLQAAGATLLFTSPENALKQLIA